MAIKPYTKTGLASGVPNSADFNVLFEQTGINNPYTSVDPTDYRLNRRGKLQYQHDLAQAQYMAEMQLMLYQNEYNSPRAQAERQREAGVNPDLAGISGDPAAGMAGNVQSPDMASVPTNGERALGIVDTTLSLFGAMSSGFFGVASGINALQGAKLGNLQKALGLVKPTGDMIGALNANELGADGKPFGALADTDAFLKKIPRRYRREVGQYLTSYIGSPEYLRKQYDTKRGESESKGAFAKASVDPTMAGDLQELMATLKPMQEAEFEVAKLLLGNRRTEADKMSAYWMHRDLGSRAEMENSQDQASKGEADIQEVIRKGAMKTIGFLEKALDEGKWWASTALSALYASMSGAMSLPSLNMSSNSSSKPDSRGNIQNSSETSWSFGF